jgi:signal transduction histidine kinase
LEVAQLQRCRLALDNLSRFRLQLLYCIPVSLFFVPVVYAALNFGFAGSIATVLWIIILTTPNWVFFHHGIERFGVIFQLTILVAVADFLGHRVDRELTARHQAETASSTLKTYAAHIVRAQEEERARIARELHDQTIQALALICRNVASIIERYSPLPDVAVKKLRQIQEMAEQAVKDVREFVIALRPSILDDLGVVTSIHRLLIDFAERTGVEGQFKLEGQDNRLPRDAEIGIFRIAQEALRNAELHSKANKVMITIRLTANEVNLDIYDDGIGFRVPPNLSSFSTRGRLGLLGMHERTETLGGNLEVRSNHQQGTRIIVSIPI